MAYVTLGARPVTAAPDTTGQNGGNYTAVIDDHVIEAAVPYFECYHMFVKAPTQTNQSTTVEVLINTNFWDATLVGQLNSWDPAQPMALKQGDAIYVLFNVPVSPAPSFIPMVTAWFRYNST